MKTQTFYAPTEIICGTGVLNNLADICASLGKKYLLVMDPFFKGSEIEKRIISLLSD